MIYVHARVTASIIPKLAILIYDKRPYIIRYW